MKSILLCTAFLMAGSVLLPAQVGQDAKDLGHDTKTAAEKGDAQDEDRSEEGLPHKHSRREERVRTKRPRKQEKGAGKVADKTQTDSK